MTIQQEYSAAIRALWARQITNDAELSGVLDRVYSSNGDRITLIFADRRWASFQWYVWPEGDGGVAIDGSPPDWEYLHAAGLLTDAERDEQQRLDCAYTAAWQEARERELFERLKARYGSHSEKSE